MWNPILRRFRGPPFLIRYAHTVSSVRMPEWTKYPRTVCFEVQDPPAQKDVRQICDPTGSVQALRKKGPRGNLSPASVRTFPFFCVHSQFEAHPDPHIQFRKRIGMTVQAAYRSPRSGHVLRIPDPGWILPLLRKYKYIRTGVLRWQILPITCDSHLWRRSHWMQRGLRSPWLPQVHEMWKEVPPPTDPRRFHSRSPVPEVLCSETEGLFQREFPARIIDIPLRSPPRE